MSTNTPAMTPGFRAYLEQQDAAHTPGDMYALGRLAEKEAQACRDAGDEQSADIWNKRAARDFALGHRWHRADLAESL